MTIPTPPGLEGLVDLACRDGVDIRPTLLRVLTDLYVQKPSHTPEEERHYVELAQRLIETVDAPTRAAVTARLISYRQVPAAMRQYIEIKTLLPDLASLTEAAPVPLPELPPAAAPLLPEATISDRQGSATRAAPERNAAAELCELFFMSNPEERRLILTNLDAVAGDRSRAFDRAGIIVANLETAALRHDSGAFARELVGAFSFDRQIAQRIVEDLTGEPILVVARALAMPQPVLQRVLLFLNPSVGQSVQRVYELAALYDQISMNAAHHLMSIFRQSSEPARPAYQAVLYQSVFWNDEPSSARQAASPRPHHVRDAEVNNDFADLPPPFRIGQR